MNNVLNENAEVLQPFKKLNALKRFTFTTVTNNMGSLNQLKTSFISPLNEFVKVLNKGTSKDELTADEFAQNTVWNFFIGKGFSKEQVAGIMGNAMQESGWNPLARSNGSSYWGLFQLNSSMATELEEKYRAAGLDMNKYGYNVGTYQGIGAEANITRGDLEKILEIQLEYIYGVKPTGSDWISAVSNASSVEEAAEAFLVRFEGAITSNKIEDNKILYYELKKGHYYQETHKRREYAKEYYQLYTAK